MTYIVEYFDDRTGASRACYVTTDQPENRTLIAMLLRNEGRHPAKVVKVYPAKKKKGK